MLLVDSHCHINLEPLSEDIPGVLERAKKNNVLYMLCVSLTLEDFPKIVTLFESEPHIFSSVGVHPTCRGVREPTVQDLVELAADANVVAIGETGLDYFRSNGDLQLQKERFEIHIKAAQKTRKPLIIHTRSAADDTMKILEHNYDGETGGVMHCFGENWSIAKRALDIGFYISFSGIVTFKNAEPLRAIARKVPEDRMLVETDAPYLAPVPYRGATNEPSLVKYTAKAIADIRGQSLYEVAEKTTENFFKLFVGARPSHL